MRRVILDCIAFIVALEKVKFYRADFYLADIFPEPVLDPAFLAEAVPPRKIWPQIVVPDVQWHNFSDLCSIDTSAAGSPINRKAKNTTNEYLPPRTKPLTSLRPPPKIH